MAKPCCSELTHSASPETQPGQEDAFPQELYRKTQLARDMLYELSSCETSQSRAGGDRADAPQCIQLANSGMQLTGRFILPTRGHHVNTRPPPANKGQDGAQPGPGADSHLLLARAVSP